MRAELLSPAGSCKGLRAAIAAGADAVYIGGELFGARAYADNPAGEELLEAIDYTHLHGKKIYLAVNTLLKNRELEGMLYSYLAPYYEQGVDAVIVQDLGVLSFIREEFPGLPIHASTQMAVTGPEGTRILKEAGVSRVVPARELSLREIRRIHSETGMELETFIHGALCYCYSGMCLFSSMLGGRSGNRGRCAQPCRLPYTAYEDGRRLGKNDGEYLLSPKDMCTIELLPEILKAGVYSLKIEGRMKKPEYAAGVTRIYRKYLDLYEEDPEGYHVCREDMQELLDLYQRDGFNQGYYKRHNGREMMALQNQKEQENRKKGVRRRNEELFSRLNARYVDKKLQEKVYGNVILFCKSPAVLNLEYGDIHIQVAGDTVQEAKKQPLTAKRVREQMEKTGNTPFIFERLDVETDEAGFLPMQSLNNLRREGLRQLETACLEPHRRKAGGPGRRESACQSPQSLKKAALPSPRFYVLAGTWEQIQAAIDRDGVDRIYLETALFWGEDFEKKVRYAAEAVKSSGKECGLALPYIQREGILETKEQGLKNLAGCLDAFLIRNMESLGYLKRLGFLHKAVCDYPLYAFNDRARAFWENQGAAASTVPLELNEGEIMGSGGSEWIVYGYYPMMVSAQCLKKTLGSCDKKSGRIELTDRYGKHFLTKCECAFCYNIIYNSVPTGLLAEAGKIRSSGAAAFRMNFTAEGKDETERILDLFLDVYKENKFVPRDVPNFTKGHFKRGVE